jgi:MSHA pilin protein MshC
VLKYSQKLALASGCPVRVEIDDAGYAARQQAEAGGTCDTDDASWGTDVALADGDMLAGSMPMGVALSQAATLTFDALGRTDLGADLSINIGPFELKVLADSGFVQAP